MARRGQCRCGLILTFHRAPHGYKMRCPSCGSVVRLRVDRKRRQRAVVRTELLALDEINVELMPPSEGPTARPAPSRHTGWIIAAVASGVLLLGVAGATWWLLG
jgi:hypothetical protein